MISWQAGLVALTQLVFYVGINSLLQWRYYCQRGDGYREWKLQQPKHTALPDPSVWWLPAYNFLVGFAKPGRHPRHLLFATINTLSSCCFVAALTERFMRGGTGLLLYPSASQLPGAGWTVPILTSSLGFSAATASTTWMLLYSAGVFLAACVYQCVAEYYWHRVMHLPWFYRRLHKYHHYYTAPSPFDDMMIHPLEGAGYYCILYSPALLFTMPLPAFLAYMAVMGLTGIFDHSGISVRAGVRGSAWFGYDTRDHDMHHLLFNCNYSFPFVFMDKLHGTYRHVSSLEPDMAGKKLCGPDVARAADANGARVGERGQTSEKDS